MSDIDKSEDKVKKSVKVTCDVNKLELRIAQLKKQKTAAKSALTKAQNTMLSLIDGEHLPTKKAVRDEIDKVSSLQDKVVSFLYELSKAYDQGNDCDQAKKTSKEIDDVLEVSDETIQTARIHLSGRSDESSSTSLRSGMSRLFRTNDTKKHITVTHEATGVNESNKQGVPYVDQRDDAWKGINTASQDDRIGDDMRTKLKRVSIPVFHGNIKEYESWKTAFIACVDKANATNEYKLLQLKQYLAGEASEVISRLGHTAAADDVALERLERKYGGKRRQIALKMEEVYNFRPIRPGNAKDLENFADLLDITVVSLREADKIEELGDGCLYSQLMRKMTGSMITNYQRWLFEIQRQESVECLREWVLKESEFQTVASEVKLGITEKPKEKEHRYSQKSGSFFGRPQVQFCNFCHEKGHQIGICKRFRELDIQNRWTKAKELKLCFRCLGTRHVGKLCRTNIPCGIEGCRSTHNRLLHDSNWVKSQTRNYGNSSNNSENCKTENKQTTTMSSTTNGYYVSSLRTVPVILKNGSRRIKVNALLDDASTQTYINEDVVSELGVHGQRQTVSVNVLNSKQETFNSMTVEVGLESVDGSVDINISALTTTKVTGMMKVIDWQKHARDWKHLHDIEFPKLSSRPIVDILIGMDYLELHCSQTDVCGQPGDPIARLTPLGWTCIGKVHDPGTDNRQLTDSFFIHGGKTTSDDKELEALVDRFWEVESISVYKPVLTRDEEMAVNAVKESLTHDSQRYTVGVPWKEGSKLPESNYDIAFNRLKQIEKKLTKDVTIQTAYEDVITQYEKKGYIRKVPEKEIKTKKSWYLPHFPVVRPERNTTKVRMVFDASAKCDSVSLNDVVQQGPKLQNNLVEILLRFRKHPIAIICDIAEMYLQIQIPKHDQPFFRFLWRSMNTEKEPDVYEFSRVVFGMNCSPFLAQYVTQEHAKSCENHLPLAAETVAKSTYMDDTMDSVETEDKALQLYDQINELWTTAGMHARKWVSNSVKVLECIPVADRLSEINIQMSELPSVKALGLLWNAENDKFQFCYKVTNGHFNVSKRAFLREIAKIFDPLGLLAPFTIRAKIILQQVWLSGVGWDDKMSPDLEEKVLQWYMELADLKSLRFPRWIEFSSEMIEFSSEIAIPCLHVFVDASQDAFGAVIYLVSGHGERIVSQLVASKSHVAPIKAVSVPRLELMAAVLGVKLLLIVAKGLEMSVHDAKLWSDSMNVLWWIKNHSRSFKPFVANRVGYIQEMTKPCQWMHVPTKLNAADILTKGSKPETLGTTAWHHGPEFLAHDESQWPEQKNDFEKSKRVASKSKLIGLQPFLDETGVMRLNGRLRFADVFSWEARFPIIIPRKSWVTKLIVKHHHEKCLHMGTNTTPASLSSKFWIVSSREEIREWENECAWCKKQKAKPAEQLMGSLPKSRVVSSMRAFVQTGVDFAGPFLTVQGRGKSRHKRYLCLFTCLATRAVHLEIAYGLDTNSFLNALFRMAHRRGWPKEMVSDNGTNFVGAVKELKQLVKSLDSDTMKSKLSNRGIVWRFNPPNAPHFGGIFESMIKSAKRAIYVILGSSDVTDEELMTAFTGVEALLNSRPLTYQSAHVQDNVPLTPNHFLHGQLGGDFAPEIDSTSYAPQKRWRRIQELIRHVWRRWMREWLPTLNVRKKWVTPSRDFKVDDVVILVSQDNPRGTWPLGRVVKTYPGKDGHVRVVEVQVGQSRFTRPVTKTTLAAAFWTFYNLEGRSSFMFPSKLLLQSKRDSRIDLTRRCIASVVNRWCMLEMRADVMIADLLTYVTDVWPHGKCGFYLDTQDSDSSFRE
ncbi:uncharacterized protein [Haliotis asinina]|uniref:uncharacterized protein n=1 Tax=Haliotis asinina TaxID=109174 RepID=UPI003531A604